MKKTSIIPIALLTLLAGCSSMSNQRIPASRDLGVKAKDGRTFLYKYVDGDIHVTVCPDGLGAGTQLEATSASCPGKSYRIPRDLFLQGFQRAILNRIHYQGPSLTRDEKYGFAGLESLSDETEARVRERVKRLQTYLQELKDLEEKFLSKAKEENLKVEKVSTGGLRDELRYKEFYLSGKKKIDAEIRRLFDLIMDGTKLHLVSSESDSLLYDAFSSFEFRNPLLKKPCGLSGSIEERIKDCAWEPDAEKGDFTLVSRRKGAYEIHQDKNTGLLWSDAWVNFMLISGEGDYIYPRYYEHAQKDCQTNDTHGIEGLSWNLPTKQEFSEAAAHGITQALRRMKEGIYWTSEGETDSWNWYVFDAREGKISTVSTLYPEKSAYVRCVGKISE